jgi:hypothetical protein
VGAQDTEGIVLGEGLFGLERLTDPFPAKVITGDSVRRIDCGVGSDLESPVIRR